MRRFLIICLFPFITSVSAQFNPEAKEIIQPVSEAILQSSGVSMNFVFTIENKQTEMVDTDSGRLLIRGNKFQLSLLGTETYFDGETQWVHMLDEGEVNISAPDASEAFELTPYSVFTLYDKGFRFKIVEEQGDVVSIDMFPDAENLPYHKIRLTLNVAEKTFVSVTAYGRDGVHTNVAILKMIKDLNLTDNEFVFNSINFPNVEIIDMR